MRANSKMACWMGEACTPWPMVCASSFLGGAERSSSKVEDACPAGEVLMQSQTCYNPYSGWSRNLDCICLGDDGNRLQQLVAGQGTF